MNRSDISGFLRRVANICRKELLVIFKDPANRIVLIAPALIQSLLFGYAATYDLKYASYALLDHSHGQASTELIARLDASGVFHRVAVLSNEQQIAPAIDSQQALMVIHIGPRFEQQLTAGEATPLQVILDARNSTTAGNAAAHLAGVVDAFNDQWRERHGGLDAPLRIEPRAWYNPNLETQWAMVPALIATLSFMQTLLLTALSVAREREQGTFDQLLVTPHSPTEIMIGKSVPSMLVGLAQSTIILLISMFWFGIPMAGSLVTLYAGLSLFTLASVGIGLSISALSTNMQQAMQFTFVLLMPMILLSGLTTPIENMPAAMQYLTEMNPLRHAIHMVRRVYLEGVGIGTVIGDLIPLIIMAVVTLPFSAWLFRHRLA